MSATVRAEHPAAAASTADVSACVRSRSSAAPKPGRHARPSPDPSAVPLPERVGDPRPDPGVALAGVVQQACDQHVRLGDALGAQRGDDVEAVAPIGDVHRVEERELGGRRSRPPAPHAPRAPRAPAGAPGTGGS